jgi:hypothetical protein
VLEEALHSDPQQEVITNLLQPPKPHTPHTPHTIHTDARSIQLFHGGHEDSDGDGDGDGGTAMWSYVVETDRIASMGVAPGQEHVHGVEVARRAGLEQRRALLKVQVPVAP